MLSTPCVCCLCLQQSPDGATGDQPFVESVSADVPPAAAAVLKVEVPPLEYLLGLADLTGELMRIAIHSVGSGDLDRPMESCRFIRQIHDAFVAFGNVSREITKKMHVMKQSLQKVETVCYTLQVLNQSLDNKPSHSMCCHLPIGAGTKKIPIQ